MLIGLILAGLHAAPAEASCAQLPSLQDAFAEADLVFVGIVTSVSNGGRTAQVEIEQVWKGEEQPFNATVHGGPIEEDLITSVDRTFEPGIYIFFPVNSSPPFEDNACTLTQPFNPSLEVINPFGEEPVDDGIDDGGGVEITSATVAASGTLAGASDGQSDDRPGPLPGRVPTAVASGIAVALAAVAVMRLWRNRRGHPG